MCIGKKILLGSQTCERKRVRCGEPQSFKREPNEVGLV